MGDPPLRALITGAVTFAAPVSVIWLIGGFSFRMLISDSLARLYWICSRLQMSVPGQNRECVGSESATKMSKRRRLRRPWIQKHATLKYQESQFMLFSRWMPTRQDPVAAHFNGDLIVELQSLNRRRSTSWRHAHYTSCVKTPAKMLAPSSGTRVE